MRDAPLAALVEAHLWIVGHFVSRYQQQAPHADLHAAGAHGLVEAAVRFDPAQRRKFTTYAWLWVKGYILQEVRRSHLVVVPEHDVRRANAAGKPVRCPVITGLPEINPVAWQKSGDGLRMDGAGAGPTRKATRRGMDVLARHMADVDSDQERVTDRAMMLRALRSAVVELEPEQRRAVTLSLEGKSAEEIASALECPRTRVAELLAQAEAELREMMT